MITLISRAYADADSARGVQQRFFWQGFPRNEVGVVSGDGADRDRVFDLLRRELVPDNALDAYADAIEGGAHFVIARATYKPLMAVKKAVEIFETSGALTLGLETRFRVKPPEDHAPFVMTDHPLFLTPLPGGATIGLISERFDWPVLKTWLPGMSAISGGRLMLGGRARTGRVPNSAMAGTQAMSKAFWPMPLLSDKPRKPSVLPGGRHPFSAVLRWPLSK